MKYRLFSVCSLALFCVLVASNTFAHAMPVRESPRVGVTVLEAPAAVKIWFDEALDPHRCKLLVRNAAGEVVSVGKTKVDRNNSKLLKISLKPLLPGTYHVYWTAVSADGHHTQGDYQFTLGEVP